MANGKKEPRAQNLLKFGGIQVPAVLSEEKEKNLEVHRRIPCSMR
jgi:hypothetical protein